MTKKDWRRLFKKFFKVIFFGIFVLFLIRYFRGECTDFEHIAICVYLINTCFNLIRRARYYTKIKRYEELFEMLEYMHRVRYEHYLDGSKEEFDELSEKFEVCAAITIEVGEILIEDEMAGKSEYKQINKIIHKVNELKETMIPPTKYQN